MSDNTAPSFALIRAIAIGSAAVLGIAAALLLFALRSEPHEFIGTLLSNPEAAPEFSLVADDGARTGLDSYEGQVVLLYFGYTFCPDICPTTLAELAKAVDLLGSDADRVQVAMISVDPERDTPEILGPYLDHFDESFVGFTGSGSEVAEVAASYNVYFAAEEGTAATGYLVDHWSGVMVVDTAGRLVEVFSYGTASEDIAADIEEWL